MPGGALPVPRGERILAPINAIITAFERVYVTRSQGAHGGAIAAALNAEDGILVDKAPDCFSPFLETTLAADLRRERIERVFVCGLATDYCVKATVADARVHGFEVVVVADAIAAYGFEPEDEAAAIEEMRRCGAAFAESAEINASVRSAL